MSSRYGKRHNLHSADSIFKLWKEKHLINGWCLRRCNLFSLSSHHGGHKGLNNIFCPALTWSTYNAQREISSFKGQFWILELGSHCESPSKIVCVVFFSTVIDEGAQLAQAFVHEWFLLGSRVLHHEQLLPGWSFWGGGSNILKVIHKQSSCKKQKAKILFNNQFHQTRPTHCCIPNQLLGICNYLYTWTQLLWPWKSQ